MKTLILLPSLFTLASAKDVVLGKLVFAFRHWLVLSNGGIGCFGFQTPHFDVPCVNRFLRRWHLRRVRGWGLLKLVFLMFHRFLWSNSLQFTPKAGSSTRPMCWVGRRLRTRCRGRTSGTRWGRSSARSPSPHRPTTPSRPHRRVESEES